MMRKSLWIIPLLLLSAAVGVPAAHADTFQYTFDLNPVLAASTPVIFDTTGPIVLGTTYTVISGSILSVPVLAFEVTGADLLEVGGSLSASLSAFTAITSGSEALIDTSNFDVGTLFATDTTTATSAPEPNGFSLLLIGLVALGTFVAVSKRKSLGTSTAS